MALRVPCGVTPRERELLHGMGNCYEACHADFGETLRMVGGNRDLAPGDVLATLREMSKLYATEPEYQKLRRRLPADFPF